MPCCLYFPANFCLFAWTISRYLSSANSIWIRSCCFGERLSTNIHYFVNRWVGKQELRKVNFGNLQLSSLLTVQPRLSYRQLTVDTDLAKHIWLVVVWLCVIEACNSDSLHKGLHHFHSSLHKVPISEI